MRVLRRDAFMAMPAGTMFCKAGVDADDCLTREWGPLCQKDQTLDHGEGLMGDFLYFEVVGLGGNDPSDIDMNARDMLLTGKSEPLCSWGARDGAFEASDVFLVFEEQDIIRVADMLGNALRAIAGQPLFEPRHTDDAAGS